MFIICACSLTVNIITDMYIAMGSVFRFRFRLFLLFCKYSQHENLAKELTDNIERFMVCYMKFYGAAAVVLHCPLLWPLRGFPHFEHVYVFLLRVAAGWTIDCSSASVEEKINWHYLKRVSSFL